MPDPSDEDVERRIDAAGRFGFILGSVAAVLAFGISMFHAPKPISGLAVLTAALMAAINVPLGIAMALVGEKVTRNRDRDRP
jgi:predicted phage tail protein